MDRFQCAYDSTVQQSKTSVQHFIVQLYGCIAGGLLLTALVSWFSANTPALMALILTHYITFFGLIIVQLAIVIVLSGRVYKLSVMLATGLFILYAMLTGLTITTIFLVYSDVSIASAFFIIAGIFAVISLWGYITKRDLSSIFSILLIGIILTSLGSLWLHSNALLWAVSYILVIVFVGLTTFETQKLKKGEKHIRVCDKIHLEQQPVRKALILYLNFFNLFLLLLHLLISRR